jgi:hypothetical protein
MYKLYRREHYFRRQLSVCILYRVVLQYVKVIYVQVQRASFDDRVCVGGVILRRDTAHLPEYGKNLTHSTSTYKSTYIMF